MHWPPPWMKSFRSMKEKRTHAQHWMMDSWQRHCKLHIQLMQAIPTRHILKHCQMTCSHPNEAYPQTLQNVMLQKKSFYICRRSSLLVSFRSSFLFHSYCEPWRQTYRYTIRVKPWTVYHFVTDMHILSFPQLSSERSLVLLKWHWWKAWSWAACRRRLTNWSRYRRR